MRKKYLGNYIKRLIERAIDNPPFENNNMGKYRISPQHGINVFVYHLYKSHNSIDEHIATIQISGKAVFGNYIGSNRKEQRNIFSTMKSLYPGFNICFRER